MKDAELEESRGTVSAQLGAVEAARKNKTL